MTLATDLEVPEQWKSTKSRSPSYVVITPDEPNDLVTCYLNQEDDEFMNWRCEGYEKKPGTSGKKLEMEDIWSAGFKSLSCSKNCDVSAYDFTVQFKPKKGKALYCSEIETPRGDLHLSCKSGPQKTLKKQ